MTTGPDAPAPAHRRRRWREVALQIGLVLAALAACELLLRARRGLDLARRHAGW